MTTRKIPGVNPQTPLGLDDLDYMQEVSTDEMRRRSMALMASYRAAGPEYGITAELDPADAVTATDPGTPLQIDMNLSNPLNIDVWPGMAFCQAGHFVRLTEKQEGIELVSGGSPASPSQYVIYLEYKTVDDSDTVVAVNRYNVSEARQTQREDDEDIVKVATFEDWQDPTIFTTERLTYCVAICLVSVIAASGGDELSIDHTRTILTENRPWFSPVDIEHRSRLGTGSSTVPHSLSLSDLSEGDLTLYMQMLQFGMILSKDRAMPGCPGKLCSETVTPARVETDDGSGTITGVANQKYVQLLAYPIRLLGAKGPSDNDIACTLLPNSHLLLLPTDEVVPASGFTLYYTNAPAAEPPTTVLIRDELVFDSVGEEELIIANGKALSTLSNTTYPIGAVGPIPQRIRIFLDENGDFVTAPQVLVCASKLEDVGTAVQTPTTTMYGNAKIKVGLVYAVESVGLHVKIKLSGTDSAGTSVEEEIEFSDSTYDPATLPSCEDAGTMDHDDDVDTYSGTAGHFILTDNVFASLTSWQITDRQNDGALSVVCIYADLDPEVSESGIRNHCPVADVVWNSQAVCRIRDIRPVVAFLTQPWLVTQEEHSDGRTLIVQLQIANGSNYKYFILAAEHIRDPHWIDYEDSVVDRFAPELRSDHIPTDKEDMWTYVSRPIEIPDSYDDSGTVFVLLYGSGITNILEPAINPTVEVRTALRSTPTTWTSWAAATVAYANMRGFYNLVSEVTSDTLKIQLKIKGKVSGWIVYANNVT